ncbi:MAG: hypothetical protein CML02_11255 [Pseudooceanicola sp.]|nr:hypothetical protein [Pseudooceanicola sp.]
MSIGSKHEFTLLPFIFKPLIGYGDTAIKIRPSIPHSFFNFIYGFIVEIKTSWRHRICAVHSGNQFSIRAKPITKAGAQSPSQTFDIGAVNICLVESAITYFFTIYYLAFFGFLTKF